MTTITESENQNDRRKAKSVAKPAARPVAKSAAKPAVRPVVFNVPHDLQSTYGPDEWSAHALTGNPLLELAFSPIESFLNNPRSPALARALV